MKKTVLSCFLVSMAFSSVSVFAETKSNEFSIPNTPIISHMNREYERSEKIATTTPIAKIQAYGKRIIQERIRALDLNRKEIEKNKTLTTLQKNTLTTQLTTNSTALVALGNTIASSTDVTSTKVLVESVFTQYRIFGIVIPKVRIEKRIYDLQNHVTKIQTTFTKVEAKIAEWKGKGKDITVLQNNLNNAKAMVATSTIQLTLLLAQAQTLTPSSFGTSSQSTIDSIQVSLKKISKDFNRVSSMLRIIKEERGDKMEKKDKDDADEKEDREDRKNHTSSSTNATSSLR